jgi:hypothetical protein
MKSFVLRAIQVVALGSLLVGPVAMAGTVYGEVVTGTGQPLPTKISFIDEAGNVESVAADAKGHYELTLQPGRYHIQCDVGTVSPETIVVFHEPRQQKIVVAKT